MKTVLWFLALLLIPVAIATSLFLVFNQTLLNSQFVKTQLAATNIYQDISSYIPTQVTTQQNLTARETQDAVSKIQTVLTPRYIQQTVEPIIDQAGAIAQGTGSTIAVNTTDVITKLQAAGLPIGNDSIKPFTFSVTDNPTLAMVIQKIKTGQKTTYSSFIVLVLLILLLSWRTRSLGALIFALILIGLLELGLAFSVRLIPDQVIPKLAQNGSEQVTHFLPKIQLLANSIASTLTKDFGLTGSIALVLAIILILVAHVANRKNQTSLIQPPTTK